MKLLFSLAFHSNGSILAGRTETKHERNNSATFPIYGWGLGAPSGCVPLASSLKQQVNKRLGALQGAFLHWVLPFLLLLFLLLDLYDGAPAELFMQSTHLRTNFLLYSCRLTGHSDLALRPADGSAGSAERQEHSCLGRLFLPFALVCANHCVFEQSGPSQAASGVWWHSLRGKVRLDGSFGSL